MPYLKYISQPPQDFGQALKISGFYIANEIQGYPLEEPFGYDTSLTPFSGASGISYFSTAASGQFFINEPSIHWSVLDPSTDIPFATQELHRGAFFQGCNISLLDETGFLVKQIATGYKGTSVRLDTPRVKEAFSAVYGDVDFTDLHKVGMDPRKLRLQVVSNDYYGRTATGEYYLTSPRPDVTNMEVHVAEDITFNPALTKKTGVHTLHLYASTVSGFDVNIEGPGSTGYDFKTTIDVDDPAEPYTFSIPAPNLESGYFYKLFAEDHFGTGSGYLYPYSIKPFTIDPFRYSQVPSGVTGKVVVSETVFDSVVRPQWMIKWNKENYEGYLDYEIKVEESGKFIDRVNTITTQNPFIEGVSTIVHGTGTGRLDQRFFTINKSLLSPVYSGEAGAPIFDSYTLLPDPRGAAYSPGGPAWDPSTGDGISWKEHSLMLDSAASFPPGYHSGQGAIGEVAMASGYTESGSVYFGFSFDPTLQEFVLYPSGGLIPNQLGVYSGIYAGEKTAGSPTVGTPGNIGNAGNGGYDNYYSQVWTGITGALGIYCYRI